MKYGRTSEGGRFGEEGLTNTTGEPKTKATQERQNKTYKEIKAELAKRRRRNQQEKIIEEL